MEDNRIKAGLQQAYALIKQGEREQAVAILKRIIQLKPDEANAWWLLANAVTDPTQQRIALERTLKFNPNHAEAKAALQRIQAAATPARQSQFDMEAVRPSTGAYRVPIDDNKPSGTAAIPSAKTQQDDGGIGVYIGIGLIVVALLMGVGVFAFLAMDNDDNSSGDDPADVVVILPTVDETLTTLTPSPRPTQRPTLPQIPTQTPTVLVTLPTFTPRPTLFRPPTRTPFAPNNTTSGEEITGISDGEQGNNGNEATPPEEAMLDIPPALGDDYWYGFDGSMNAFTQGGGYYRFTEFPVLFYQGPVPDPGYQIFIEDALAQIGQVVPIQRTDDIDEARLFLEFWPADELSSFCGAVVEGCGALFYDPELYQRTGEVEYYGIAVILNTTTIPEVVILHELMHAVGVMVHSGSPNDIMYYRYTQGFVSLQLTERDLNTLRRLYTATPFTGNQDDD